MRKLKSKTENLPKGWRKVKIKDIGKVITGKTPSTFDPLNFGGPYPFITIPDLKNQRYIKKTERTLSEKGAKLMKGLKLPPKTVMVSCLATVGEIGITVQESFTNQQINSVICNESKVIPEFLYYYFKYSKPKLLKYSGSVYVNISKSKFENFEVIIPEDINEQKRIVDILSAFDEKIELNNKIIKTLEEIAQAIFKEWFVKFRFPGWEKVKFVDSELGKIPEGWRVSTIGKELKTILGGTPSTSRSDYWENGNIPWINSGALNDFPIINPTSFITQKGLNNSAAKIMPIKTVVVPLVVSVGKPVNISMLAIESAGNQSVVGIVPTEKLPASYIYCWIKTKKENIYAQVSGGAQQHINKQIIDLTQILIPNYELLQRFKSIAEPLFDSIIQQKIENQKLAALRDLLLPKLMSGEIRV